MKKKESFFKAYYRNMKELNVSLIIIVALFVVVISGVTSYALFGTEVFGEKTISLSVGLPKTSDECFAINDLGTITDFKCYENNLDGLYAVYDVVIPMSINNITVNEIGDFAFESKGINSVVLPNSLSKIGSFAFNYNNLTEVSIPKNVEIIADGAFSNNQLTSVSIVGKSSISDFEKFGKDVFSFVDGDSSSIIFK